MSKRSFLVVPAKHAYDLDIASRINSYVQTCLSLTPETQQSVKEGLDELNRQRRNAFLHDECGKSVSSIENMQKYFDCFSALSDKIQIRDGDCPIPFRWKSAFTEKSLFTGKRDLTLNYAGYEKACVLFNIAAYQSKYAGSLELGSDEDLRVAVRYFQSSANIFDLLKNDIMAFVSDEIPRDMQPQLLNALSQLMITQANEVMYIKALKDNNSPAILRTIAMQLADNYESVFKLLSYDQARGIVDKSWYSIIQAKQYAFWAYGNKHQFDHLESGGLEAIEERLGRANEVLEYFKLADQVYPHAYDGEVKNAKQLWEKTEKDNNLIYHARVPKKTELPEIPRKLVLNVGTVKFPLSKDFKDMFVQLVSVHVNKAVNLFQQQLKNSVFALINDVRTSKTNVNSGLASINMPALIEDELKQERIPESIVHKCEEIRSKGAFHAIETQEKSLAQASNEANAMISKIRKTLDEEERSDTALRAHYGARWSTMNSGKLTDKFKQEVGKYSGIIRTANEADEKVKGKIRLCERDVNIMSGPRESLVERIPPITSNATHKSQAVQKLRELWEVMSREMDKVDGLEKRLNEIKYDPTSEFLEMLKKDGSLDDAKVGEFARTKIESITISKEVNDSKNLRLNALEEMRVWHQHYNTGSQGVDEGRTKALQQLAAAYDAYLECQSNLKEGTKFYNDLQALLIRLQQQVDDFCFARQTEKEDIIAVLEPGKSASDVIKGLTDSAPPVQSSNVPPPRPPPPSTISPQQQGATMSRLPDMGQMNLNNQAQTAPSVPPRSDANAPLPSVPQHQAGYQPNTAPNFYQQPQQYQGYPQSYQQPGYPQTYQQQGYQQMHLPYYGAMQQPGPQQQQPNFNPYNAPYPTQFPGYYPQPPQFAPQQNQQPSAPGSNPFAQ